MPIVELYNLIMISKNSKVYTTDLSNVENYDLA